MTDTENSRPNKRDFIRAIIANDVNSGKHRGNVVTRFPPEPNGFLHIGHAKSICLNFSAAAEHQGTTHLRLDDTNPETEEKVYADSIQKDIQWLGFDWGTHLYHASDYFGKLYEYAEELIRKSLAYVDSLDEIEIREYRGSVTKSGRESPFRNRSVAENLKLFRQMKTGDFSDGQHVLRAKIDMSSPNMLMRDPILYRIRHTTHYRTQDNWCLYPLYDFTHCLSDSIEGITHSICTLEFENNREVYDWILDNLDILRPQPRQYEFARLNLEFTILSKRKLLQLVEGKFVSGWDDPRMPTIAGIRRRGVPAKAIRDFCHMIGVAKTENRVDLARFEYAIRNELNYTAPRVMCVLRPLKVVILNYDSNSTIELEAPYYPEDIGTEGARLLPFTREIFIEKTDFEENPAKGFRRLSPGEEVRLRYAYIIKCEAVVKDQNGELLEVHCTYDPDTQSGANSSNRKVKGTIHWVSATESLPAEIRLYDRLFNVPNPEDIEENGHFTDNLNPQSLIILKNSRIEQSVASDHSTVNYQFERSGNFISDSVDSRPGNLVFNRTVTLKDSWGESQDIRGQKRATAQGNRLSGVKQKPRVKHSIKPKTTSFSETELNGAKTLITRFNIPENEAMILFRNPSLMRLFTTASEETSDYTALSKWCVNEIPKNLMDKASHLSGKSVAKLVRLISSGAMSAHSARRILTALTTTDRDLDQILSEDTYDLITDSRALQDIVSEIIDNHPIEVQKYFNGKTEILSYLVGQVMKATKGSAEPRQTKQLIEACLQELK
jgi:glutaminyl-tRNA synthetase